MKRIFGGSKKAAGPAPSLDDVSTRMADRTGGCAACLRISATTQQFPRCTACKPMRITVDVQRLQ